MILLGVSLDVHDYFHDLFVGGKFYQFSLLMQRFMINFPRNWLV